MREKSLIQALVNCDFRKDLLSETLLLKGKEREQLFELAREKRTEYFPSEEVEVRSMIEISNICQRRCNFCNINSYPKKKDTSLNMNTF